MSRVGRIKGAVVRGAIAAMNVTLTGLHRAVMRIVGSPDLHSRFAQRMWSTYYDSGKVLSQRTRPKEQTISYTGWTSHHPLICTMTCASDQVIFPLMGLKNVQVKRVSCVDGGSTRCAHKVTWA